MPIHRRVPAHHRVPPTLRGTLSTSDVVAGFLPDLFMAPVICCPALCHGDAVRSCGLVRSSRGRRVHIPQPSQGHKGELFTTSHQVVRYRRTVAGVFA